MKAVLSPGRRIALAERLFGWRPHPTQALWLLDDSRIKVAACGRRWGKTEAAAVDAATFAIAAPGCVQMIVSPTYDQSRLIFDTVERLILGRAITRKVAKVTRTPYPRLQIGASLIMARTADEDGRNLRGHSADRVIVDEAAYVRDAVVEEVIGPMLADRSGQLVMISTPFGKNHFYRAFVQGDRGWGYGGWLWDASDDSTSGRERSGRHSGSGKRGWGSGQPAPNPQPLSPGGSLSLLPLPILGEPVHKPGLHRVPALCADAEAVCSRVRGGVPR